jgi:hypothetical protein
VGSFFKDRLANLVLLVAVEVADAAEVLAVVEKNVGEVGEPSHFGEAEEEVEIFEGGVLLAIAPDLLDGAAAHDDGRVDDGPASVEVGGVDRSVIKLVDPGADGEVVGVDEENAGADEDVVRVGVEEGDLFFQAVGEREVVGIHAGDEFALALRKAVVEGAHDAGIGAGVDVEAGISFSQGVEDVERFVGGSVVDGDDLEVREGLGKNALDRAAEVRLGVVHGNEDGDAGGHFGVTLRISGAADNEGVAEGIVVMMLLRGL